MSSVGTKTAVFDMNETTLDLAPIRSVVNDVLEPEGGFVVWFQKLLQLSMTMTAVGEYRDFSGLAADALGAVAATSGRSIEQDALPRLRAAFGELQAYTDVAEGLRTLRSAGWSTIALTNSAPASVEGHVAGAGLADLFDHVISVERVRTYKPAAAPYQYVADLVGTDAGDMVMVACHDWDLAGARAVGYRTAFIDRPGMSYADTYPSPDYRVPDFGALATALLAA